MADSRRLDDLQPTVHAMVEELLAHATAVGIPLTVTFTLRDMATQDALYARGRTCPGCIVTDARAGYSFHHYGLAVDVMPTELLALPSWGDTPDHQARTDALWARVGALGKALGFRWGGECRSIRDRPHFEWSGTLTLADLRAGKRPTAPAPAILRSTPHTFTNSRARQTAVPSPTRRAPVLAESVANGDELTVRAETTNLLMHSST